MNEEKKRKKAMWIIERVCEHIPNIKLRAKLRQGYWAHGNFTSLQRKPIFEIHEKRANQKNVKKRIVKDRSSGRTKVIHQVLTKSNGNWQLIHEDSKRS